MIKNVTMRTDLHDMHKTLKRFREYYTIILLKEDEVISDWKTVQHAH